MIAPGGIENELPPENVKARLPLTCWSTNEIEPAGAVVGSGILSVVGAWRSLVAHLNGVQEAERSNRSAPTIF